MPLKTKTEEIQEITKEKWKTTIKERIERVIKNEVRERAEKRTKLRFVKDFRKQEYMETKNLAVVKEYNENSRKF